MQKEQPINLKSGQICVMMWNNLRKKWLNLGKKE